jgi:hypothetical protein
VLLGFLIPTFGGSIPPAPTSGESSTGKLLPLAKDARITTMSEWLPMFALANIEVKNAIEVDGFALASIHDPRVQELARAHPSFKEFLNRFTTEFGQPVTPKLGEPGRGTG